MKTMAHPTVRSNNRSQRMGPHSSPMFVQRLLPVWYRPLGVTKGGLVGPGTNGAPAGARSGDGGAYGAP